MPQFLRSELNWLRWTSIRFISSIYIVAMLQQMDFLPLISYTVSEQDKTGRERDPVVMEIREITVKDIPSILPLYVSYYNEQEDCCWTEDTAQKRIHQVFCMEDFYGLLLECSGTVVGFAVGYFKQYDDIVGYYLDEIVIAAEHQNRGYGSKLLKELERRVYEKGAACVELQAVADEHHEHYYGKAGYHDAVNFVLKVKWFDTLS